MSARGRNMFVDRMQAAAIEAAEARVTLTAARSILARSPSAMLVELGPGIAFASGEESPFDKIVGLGFGSFEPEALGRFEAQVLAGGLSLRAEIASLADPEIARAMTARGYELSGFENVLVRELGELPGSSASPGSVEVRLARADETSSWIETVTRGFLEGDAGSPGEPIDRAVLEQVFADMAAADTFRAVLAFREGVAAGGAGLRLDGTLAQLCGASTLPPHRRRGVQSALLRFRLAHAATNGCTLATVTTEPGSPSQANAMRAGFGLAYVRSVLVKRAPGQ